MPERIQLRRTKGWRKPAGAIVVARPTKWGNPFTVAGAIEAEYENPQRACVNHFRAWLEGADAYDDSYEIRGPRGRVNSYNRRWILEDLDELRGHDLACWCPLDQPCHADVLLEFANRGPLATTADPTPHERSKSDAALLPGRSRHDLPG
ncbi:hypothetical protein C5E45_32890 [Nocardia nova]|uniref:DUF4326 domain-containing protein n=1 Tax=Nocardia nova TaxID=37330 RepID=A0A2S6ACW9_9NOCA|nr:DUF4326 domain-containing protein [Nocardia nova]PPJ31889.1 hypothetical protein C5E45_32890 [Nocardia nova]